MTISKLLTIAAVALVGAAGYTYAQTRSPEKTDKNGKGVSTSNNKDLTYGANKQVPVNDRSGRLPANNVANGNDRAASTNVT